MYKDPSLPPRPLAGRRAEPSATPPGCRTYQSVYQCDTLAGSRDRLRCLIHGSSGLRPSTCGPIDVLTSTPCGSQRLSLRCAATRMGARSEINSHTSVLATLWFDRCLGSGHPCVCSHAGSQMRSPVRDNTSRWLSADGEPLFLNPVLDFSITGFSVDYYRL